MMVQDHCIMMVIKIVTRGGQKYSSNKGDRYKSKQAGAELGQAQLKLGLDFDLINLN